MTTENASSLAISRMEAFVKEYMKAYDPSHDWAHVNRVRNTALKLAATLPGVDMLVVELVALMHDLNDAKYAASKPLSAIAAQVFVSLPLPTPAQLELILKIVPAVSYSKEMKLRASGDWGEWHESCAELHAVQDADRLDASGAVGVLRCAAYSGVTGRELVGGETSAVGHFHDKLLKIRDYMKTEAGRKEAEVRHQTIIAFLTALESESSLW